MAKRPIFGDVGRRHMHRAAGLGDAADIGVDVVDADIADPARPGAGIAGFLG
jgi:hypothetical protein